MSKRKLIENRWNEFKKVIPEGAPSHQAKDMKMAFFAGAQCLLTILITGVSPGLEETQKDLELMDEVTQELMDFLRHVANGTMKV